MQEISKNILTTIIYYDLLDYPLTSFEIWKYLLSMNNDQGTMNNIKLGDVVKELEDEEVEKFVEQYRGFYFLKGRKNLVSERLKRNKIALGKLKLTKKVVRWLRFVPYVRMIAVTGRLAMKNTEKKSDLDLLIVLGNKHIFTGRLLATLVTHILGKRRYKNKISDRACLNYFITDKSLEIELKDIFSSSEYSFIFPLFGEQEFIRFQESNDWIKNYRNNYIVDHLINNQMIKDTKISANIRTLGEKLVNFKFIESFLCRWQLVRIEKNPKTHQKGSVIIANDYSLVFLPEPQGPKIAERFVKRMEKVIY